MKINFVISKTYNLFHFVQNMSEWSKYCRAKENRDWILKMGPLNEQEKEALADVADVLKIYGYDKPVDDYRNIFEFFATLDEHRDYSSRLEKLIGKESADSLPISFSSLDE